MTCGDNSLNFRVSCFRGFSQHAGWDFFLNENK